MSKKRREKIKAKAARHTASKPSGQQLDKGRSITEPPRDAANIAPAASLKDAAPEWSSFYASIQAAARIID